MAGLLTLWRDELLSEKKTIIEDETDEQKNERLEKELKQEKTKKLKLASSFFIFLTLLFTLYQIHLTDMSAKQAVAEKTKQHLVDSARYADENKAHNTIDSIKKVQIEAYMAQITAGKSIDSIKIKSVLIMDNLSAAETELNKTTYLIQQSAQQAKNSFKDLTLSSQRLLYPLDSNLSLKDVYMNIWIDTIVGAYKNYVAEHNLKNEVVPIYNNSPFAADIKYLMKNFRMDMSFESPTRGNLIELINKSMIRTAIESDFKRRDPGPWLGLEMLPTNVLEVKYYTPGDCLFFQGERIALAINWKNANTNSILDLLHSKIKLNLVFPILLENPGLLTIRRMNFAFTIDFSGKKYSFSYKGEGDGTGANAFYQTITVDSLK